MELREARVVTPGLALGFIAIVLVLVAGVVVALTNVGTSIAQPAPSPTQTT